MFASSTLDPASARADLLRLWADAGLRSDERKFDWYYAGHPVAPPAVVTVRPAGVAAGSGAAGAVAAVGACALGARAMAQAGRPLRALVRGDLCVVPAHRRSGAAVALLSAVRELGTAQADLVYGLPNRHAAPAVRAAGFTELGHMTTFSWVLDGMRLLARRAGLGASGAALAPPLGVIDAGRWSVDGLELAACPAPDDAFDALWSRCRGGPWALGVRDAGFLRWRLAEPSASPRRLLAARDAGGRLVGYAVLGVERPAMSVVDLLVDPQQPALIGPMLEAVRRAARAAGADALHLSLFAGDDLLRPLGAGAVLRRRHLPVFAAGPLLRGPAPPALVLTPFDTDAV